MNRKDRVAKLEEQAGVDLPNIVLVVACNKRPERRFPDAIYQEDGENLEAACIHCGFDPAEKLKSPRKILQVTFPVHPKQLDEIVKRVQGSALPIIENPHPDLEIAHDRND